MKNSIYLICTADGNSEVLYINGEKKDISEQISSSVWLQILEKFQGKYFNTGMKFLTDEATEECYEYGFPVSFNEFKENAFE
ncbi:hypothetical protein [Paenibacillus sp. FSL H3-0286]